MIVESKKSGLLWNRKEHFKITDRTIKRKSVIDPVWFNKSFGWTILQIDGGGILGIIPLFFLLILENAGVNCYNFFRSFWGTSTGGIIAAMLNCGYSVWEIFRTYVEMGSEIFTRRPFMGGLSQSKFKKDFIRELLQEKIGDVTFKELFDKTGKELNLAVVNCTDEQTEVWNYRTQPDTLVRIGVEATMSAPVYFDPLWYKGKMYRDGGMGVKNCMADNAVNDAFYRLKKKASDIYILSMGTGQGMIGMSDGGKLKEAVQFIGYMRKDAVQVQTKQLFYWQTDEGLNYHRIDPVLPTGLSGMDKTDNINEIVKWLDSGW